MTQKNFSPSQIAAALCEAQIAAYNADTEAIEKAGTDDHIVIDGGTCNLDSVIINLKGWQQKKVDQINAVWVNNPMVGDKLSGWHKGYRWVNFTTYGQAERRTRMVEAARKSLKASGLGEIVSVYYAMD
jgi:hypothetical protein